MPLQTQNPFALGIREPDWSNVSNLFQNYAKGYEAGQTPQKMAAERLKESLMNTGLQQQNEYNPRRWESEIGLNQAHGGAYNAQAGEHRASTVQKQIIAKMLQDVLNEEQGYGNNQPSAPGMQGGQGVGEPQQGVSGQQEQQSQPGQNPKNNYLKRAVAAHHLGVPQHHPQITPGNEILTFDPLTGQPTVSGGLRTPESIERGKGLAQHDVEAIKENYKSYTDSVRQKAPLQGILKILDDPSLDAAVGPGKNKLAKYLGSDRTKEMQANFSTLGKSIVTESAKSFTGGLTNRELDWLKDVLPNVTDTLPAIKGKVRTLEFLRSAIEQKSVMKDQLIRKYEMDPILADQMADKAIDYDAIKREIKPTRSFKGPNGVIKDIPRYDLDYIKEAEKRGYVEGDY